jgi:uncharacterized protein YjbJ (UPF0337 family)
MLKVTDVIEVSRGLADKTLGLFFEATGTVLGSDRLTDAGRARQEAGNERLMAVEEEAKATGRAGEAEVQERRQKQSQPVEKRSTGRSVGDHESVASGAAEKVKGLAKEGLGKVTGNEEMQAEGEAQQDKAEAETQAAKHAAKAGAHREKAEGALKISETRR